jgi:hypothetical protein
LPASLTPTAILLPSGESRGSANCRLSGDRGVTVPSRVIHARRVFVPPREVRRAPPFDTKISEFPLRPSRTSTGSSTGVGVPAVCRPDLSSVTAMTAPSDCTYTRTRSITASGRIPGRSSGTTSPPSSDAVASLAEGRLPVQTVKTTVLPSGSAIGHR